MTQALINKIIQFSAVDGPGNRCAIFFQGCNYNCSFCHNPETISFCRVCGDCIKSCPVNALTLEEGRIHWDDNLCVGCDACIRACSYSSTPKTRTMTADQVWSKIQKSVKFIRGITVSGGEATLNRDFIYELFRLAQSHGLSCFIDSNGSYDFSLDPSLMDLTDSVMLDVKSFSNQEHLQITGRHNETALKNLAFLCEQKKLYEVRTVISPGLFDIEGTLLCVGNYIKNYPDVRYKLIKFRPDGVRQAFRNLNSPTDRYMENLAIKLNENGIKNVVIS